MVKEIKIYIEGDSAKRGKNSAISLTKGFHYFFNDLIEKAREKNIKINLILGGSTDLTFRIFQNDNGKSKDAFYCFLVDSDKPLEDDDTPKTFLLKEKKWDLKNIDDEQCQLMVQIMESWFLADVETLQSYYGQKFNSNAIPKINDVEKIAKLDVENSLNKATKDTQKGVYHKIKHGAELLSRIDVIKIRQKAKHCQRVFQTIEEKIDGV
jgi:hypothetical protein